MTGPGAQSHLLVTHAVNLISEIGVAPYVVQLCVGAVVLSASQWYQDNKPLCCKCTCVRAHGVLSHNGGKFSVSSVDEDAG
jgi:hypothetical protein